MILIYSIATVSNVIYGDAKEESLKKKKKYKPCPWTNALKEKREIAHTHFWPSMATGLDKPELQ